MANNSIQLCDTNGKILLCAGNAKIQLATRCACPCETWPPASWPCGGLLEVYHCEWTLEYRSATDQLRERQEWAADITADPTTPCTWRGIADRTIYDYARDDSLCGTRNVSFETVVSLIPCACLYRFEFAHGAKAEIAFASGPDGIYTPTDSDPTDNIAFQYGDTCDGAVVVENGVVLKITSFEVT